MDRNIHSWAESTNSAHRSVSIKSNRYEENAVAFGYSAQLLCQGSGTRRINNDIGITDCLRDLGGIPHRLWRLLDAGPRGAEPNFDARGINFLEPDERLSGGMTSHIARTQHLTVNQVLRPESAPSKQHGNVGSNCAKPENNHVVFTDGLGVRSTAQAEYFVVGHCRFINTQGHSHSTHIRSHAEHNGVLCSVKVTHHENQQRLAQRRGKQIIEVPLLAVREQ